MTDKEKVLEVWPGYNVYPVKTLRANHPQWRILVTGTGFIKNISDWMPSEEAAWQNAAESLPAEAEQEVCKYCDEPLIVGSFEWVHADKIFRAHDPTPKSGNPWIPPVAPVEDKEVPRPKPQGGDYRPHYRKDEADAYMDRLEYERDVWRGKCRMLRLAEPKPTPSTPVPEADEAYPAHHCSVSGQDRSRGPAMTPQTRALIEAAEAMMAKLEQIEPSVNAMIGVQFARTGWQYDGPNYAQEKDALKSAISSAKAAEEGVDGTYEDWAGSSICEQGWIEAEMVALEALESIKRSLYVMPASQYGIMCTAIRRIQPLWETELRRREAWNAVRDKEGL